MSSIAFSASHNASTSSDTKALEAINTILINDDEQRVDKALSILDKHWRVEYIANVL